MKNDITTKLRSASEALHHGVVENAVGPWLVQIDASSLLEIATITEDAATEIDRLRGELVTSRQLHSVAAESAEKLLKENKRLSKDTERLDWIDANQEMFDEAWRFSDSGNMIRDIIDTERERGKQ